MPSEDNPTDHNTKSNDWVTYDVKNLNIINFLSVHPGGEEILLLILGKDINPTFKDAGHSLLAEEMISELLL